MSISVIIGIIVVVFALSVFLFIARRAMRWAIRLALLGIVVLALLAGALAWWLYYGSSAPAKETRPAATRRANSR
jgi:heme/copper-type cytochrome/quinol oxidase subunit 4